MRSTRERIMDAAWGLFVRRGYAGTTVTQIEAEASLAAGSGSFYRHFRSKEDVFQAVVDREVERVDAARDVGTDLLGGGDPRVALALEFRRRLETLRRLQPLMTLAAQEQGHLGSSRQRLRQLLIERNLSLRTERVAEAMASGALPSRDAATVTATVMCALTGYHLSREFFGEPPGGIGEDEFVSSLVDLVAGDAHGPT